MKKNNDELNNVLKELEELEELERQNEAKNSKEKTDNSDTKETKIQYIIIPFIIIFLVILLTVDIADTDSFLIQEYSEEYDVKFCYSDTDITDGVYDWNEYYKFCIENEISLSYTDQSVNYIIIRRTSNDKFRNRECAIG